MRGALARHELFLEFQPQWSLKERRLRGFEALLRWRREDGQLVSPGIFIPELEANGGIVSVGQGAATEAVSIVSSWPLVGDIVLSINASARQLRSNELVDTIESILSLELTPPAEIEVEITETVLLPDLPFVAERLDTLKDLGVRLALDNFGVGYSSLSHLHRFPIDTLKVDRSLISSMEQDERCRSIVRAIVNLGHELNMSVVAEGIEQVDDLEYLANIGCDLAQGYLLGRPRGDWPTEALETVKASYLLPLKNYGPVRAA